MNNNLQACQRWVGQAKPFSNIAGIYIHGNTFSQLHHSVGRRYIGMARMPASHNIHLPCPGALGYALNQDKLVGIGMVNQQKHVQQETAYSVVLVNDHMYPRPYIV